MFNGSELEIDPAIESARAAISRATSAASYDAGMSKAGRYSKSRPTAKIGRSFYAVDAETLARALIGTVLVHQHEKIRRARIVETEAYVGEHDLACHAAKGRTNRTEVMFGPPGHAYVYFIYGMYDMLNIVCSRIGDAQAVLIRAAEPLDGWDADLAGPGKLCRAMQITRRLNGVDLLGDELYLTRDESERSPRIVACKRIGVDYAEDWAHAALRFVDADSKCLSRKPEL